MNKIFFGILVSVLFFCLAGICCAASPKNAGNGEKIRLTITTDKESYNIGDKVQFCLQFCNTTQKDIYLNVNFSPSFGPNLLLITDSVKKICPREQLIMIKWIYAPDKKNFVLINVGETYSLKVNGTIFEGPKKGIYINFGDILIDLKNPGVFEVTANYENDYVKYHEKEIFEKFGIKNVFSGALKSTKLRDRHCNSTQFFFSLCLS